MEVTTTGGGNTAVGYQSLYANTTGANNTALGTSSLSAHTTGSSNLAVGKSALEAATTSSNNTALGSGSLASTTTGYNNIGAGTNSMSSNTTGANNVAIGRSTMSANTTGASSTAVGYRAGYSQTTNGQTVYVGTEAGFSATGYKNCFVGYQSGDEMTSGNNNTILGSYNGNQGSLDIRTASNQIVLSDGDGNPRMYYDANTWKIHNTGSTANANLLELESDRTSYTSTAFLISAERNTSNSTFNAFRYYNTGAGANRFIIRDSGNALNTNNSYGAISDETVKKNITDAASQWDDIKAISVRKFHLNEQDDTDPKMLGVVAQEIEQVSAGLVDTAYDEGEDRDIKTVKYSVLYMKAVKALQEAMTRIETLEAKVAALEAE